MPTRDQENNLLKQFGFYTRCFSIVSVRKAIISCLGKSRGGIFLIFHAEEIHAGLRGETGTVPRDDFSQSF